MRSKAFRAIQAAGSVSFNMTPMIDCTLLLIIFFILTSQIASTALEVPRVLQSQAKPRQDAAGHLVVNVLSTGPQSNDALAPGRANRYEVEGLSVAVGDIETLVRLFNQRKTIVGADRLAIEVRADYRVPFADVEPVLQAGAAAGIAKVSLSARLRSAGQPEISQ